MNIVIWLNIKNGMSTINIVCNGLTILLKLVLRWRKQIDSTIIIVNDGDGSCAMESQMNRVIAYRMEHLLNQL